MSNLNGKQRLLCRAWVGSGLQLYQQERGRAQLPLSGSEDVEVSAGNCMSSLIRHRSCLCPGYSREMQRPDASSRTQIRALFQMISNPIRQHWSRGSPPWAEAGWRRRGSCQ